MINAIKNQKSVYALGHLDSNEFLDKLEESTKGESK
jgi:hypothetical protein